MFFVRALCRSMILLEKCSYRGAAFILKNAFHRHGKNLIFDPCGEFSYRNIDVGDNVSIGGRAVLLASDSRIILGNNVMLGPNVTMVAGNHNISVIGKAMYDVHEKRPEDDQDIVIHDDVWIYAGAIILKGVQVGRGSVIGAGALVNTDVCPYTIVCGVPAHKVSTRFPSLDCVRQHEAMLYTPDQRLPEPVLQMIYA